MVRAIVGANWGDEGKGKLTDVLAEQSDIVVRYQGGANAGHTIINEHGKFALHRLPSGIFYQSIVNIIGPSVALDIEALFSELDGILSRGLPRPKLMVLPSTATRPPRWAFRSASFRIKSFCASELRSAWSKRTS